MVAALPGAAAGAGLSIALAADIRIAAERAVLVTAFAGVGASGDFGGSWFLTQLVGTAKAKELYFTSPRLSANEARELGMVDQVLPKRGLRASGPVIVPGAGRPCADRHQADEGEPQRAITCDLGTALDGEAANMVRSMSTADHREAAAAFVEKRSPVFRGE